MFFQAAGAGSAPSVTQVFSSGGLSRDDDFQLWADCTLKGFDVFLEVCLHRQSKKLNQQGENLEAGVMWLGQPAAVRPWPGQEDATRAALSPG